ncbi:DUF2867 domain-containing protein [Agrobacterium tumefaciens]|uniref:DUF2867 domain-containing protein n=1 Tax=Agrobacterium tumefaciens TaxID=358 RepID=UPI0015739983|nr:DUF2867 domain-containing protein [Agrobacterium tumefaciens]NTD87658.1 DUF2867 domain-containing protein [Agrobacterium tumefaciens]NTD91533.1 DUF2867 domain-containing protein [Agrobacterium tumefaciens]NTD95518.1 DUF2867 domain-containing protein [Agrobacterium tumefaciens]NTE11628.1 DUF2867 domain-containing protein [Agrobacterium tumefaciens]NTE25073.1 DUF2867 domain-containing protein [Agrobacterium tumefaciens]
MSRNAIVTEQSPPMHSRLNDWYREADLLDSYAAELPADSDADIRSIAYAFFEQPAPWPIRTLMSIRDRLGRRLWLLKSSNLPDRIAEHNQIGFLPVLSTHADELILGRNDRHMNFRISLLIKKSVVGPDYVYVTTVVRCQTRRGRAYLAVIRPFHRLLVPYTLRRAAEVSFAVTKAG